MRRFLAVLLTLVAIFGAGWLSLRRPDIPFDTLESAYASPESQYLVLSDSEKIHYRDQGTPDGPVIVLVHGFSASLHTWEPWVRALGDEYRLISLDLPGHGLTRGFELDQMNVEGFGETITALTDALDVDRFTLVGSSMGGHTAWTYAVDHPDDIEALVLVAAAGWPPTDEELKEMPWMFKAMDYAAFRTIVRDLDNSAMIRSGLEASFVDQTPVTEDMVQRYVALNRAPGHRDAIMHIISESDETRFATPEQLSMLDMPVLVVHGTGDNLVPYAHGAAFADAIAGASLITYTDIGHLPQEEIARQSAGDLDMFLDGLELDQRTVTEETVLSLGE
ncbi:MAG: alpha/beta hydrolase [Hyphomonadaceae bacterium]|nr:alpha/beta hydrolase [Hyphomonadaceae bacterium]